MAVAGSAVALLAVIAIPASALSPGKFEGADGNMVVNTANNKDWATLPALDVSKQSDLPPGANDDSFNAKEDTPVPNVETGSIPPNKSDLQRLYVSTENVAVDADPNNNVDMLYLGWTRVQEPSGTTNMDFELNQSQTLSANGVTYERTAGDVLLTYDLSKGGTVPVIRIGTWLTSGPSSACEASSSLPCWSDLIALAAPKSEGGINPVGILNALDNNSSLSARTFGEAAINLQAAGIFSGTACRNFGSAFVKSRSSDSFTAAMKDFIRPVSIALDSCPDKTITLKKLDGNGAALAGATMQLWRDTNANGTLQPGTDAQVGSDCVTTADGIGNCTFTIGMSGTYIGHESVAPAGYDLTAPDVAQVVVIDKTGGDFVLEFTDLPEPGQFTVKKRNVNGTLALDAKFTLYRDVDGDGTVSQGDTVVGDENQATGADGDFTYTNLEPGKYVVVETVAPEGYDLPADPEHAFEIVIADGGDAKEFTFNDTPTPGSIALFKRDADTDQLLSGAHFTLYRDDGDGVFEPGEGGDQVVDDTCVTSIGLNSCSYTGLEPGRYWVEETQAPNGYDLPSPAFDDVVIDIADGGDDEIVTFHNSPTLGSITVHKQDDDDPHVAVNGATFALYSDDNGDGLLDAGDDLLGECDSGDDGTGICTFADLPPGKYLVKETVAPDGYDLPPLAERVQAVTLTTTQGGDDENVTFTDPRKFNVIVLVCKDDGDTLYPSSVTFDGATKTSAGVGDLPAGVTEAAACGIGGARYTGKHFGPYTSSANIPK